MSKRLKIEFEMEMSMWIQQVKTENISQILTITEKEISLNKNGTYKIVAIGRAEFYANHQYLGYENQIIEMVLQLVPPKSGKRWYLQINSLSMSKDEIFNTKNNLSKGN